MGISSIRAQPQIVEAIMAATSDESKKTKEKLEHAKRDAELARREVESGFPILYSWAVVGLWALLESTVRTFISEWLKHKPTAWRTEPIKRLRIRLSEYESIPRNQRHRFVAEQLERQIGSNLKEGLNRFESLLDPFGLSGALPDQLRRDIYEFSQVRNLIAHNASKVDRRFKDSCPWLGLKIGDTLHVSNKMWAAYMKATLLYMTIIICRIGEHFGSDMSKMKLSAIEEFERQHNAITPQPID